MRLLRKIPTAEKVGYHPEYMMELVRKGKFLRPVSRPGSHLVFFVEHEVDEYIAERIAARDAGLTVPRNTNLRPNVAKQDSDTFAGSAT